VTVPVLAVSASLTWYLWLALGILTWAFVCVVLAIQWQYHANRRWFGGCLGVVSQEGRGTRQIDDQKASQEYERKGRVAHAGFSPRAGINPQP
jgi:small-conductance mechanosensitive channel